jgi:hypothetical protein
MIEGTKKKLREAGFFLQRLVEEERHIYRPEPEARDFYLSAFLSAARSVGDFIGVEEGERYREWFEHRKLSLSDEERDLLRFTNDQRVQSVHIRGPNVQANITHAPIHELQRELHERGGSLEIRAGGVPGSPLPLPKVEKSTLSFSELPDSDVSDVCGRYLELLARVLSEYEQFVVADHPGAA